MLEGELLRALGHEEAATESCMRALVVARKQGSDGFGRRVKESLERQAHERAEEPPPDRPGLLNITTAISSLYL